VPAGAEILPACALNARLVQVNVDGDAIARIPAVVQVISVARVVDVHIIVVIPIVGPVFRPWIGEAEPIATVLKAGISADDHHRVAVNAERVIRTKVTAIAVFGNAIAVVAPALLPITVLRLPVTRATLLPGSLLFALLPVLLLLGLHMDLLHMRLLV
jgi:hypothetical protein